MLLAVHRSSASDSTFKRDWNGSLEGAAIVVRLLAGSGQVPLLSEAGIATLVLLLLGVAWSQWRRGSAITASILAALATFGGAVVVYAAFGNPVAVDELADADPLDPRAEIYASFAMETPAELQLRLDIQNLAPELDCADGTDNDVDGLVDCEDPDCANRPCNDVDACTIDDHCLPNTCSGIPKTNIAVANGGCDDSDPCTIDMCSAGACMYSTPPEICDNGVDDDCDSLVDGDDPDCNFFNVFATSTIFEGNFGGAAAADAICNDVAANAGLVGTFVAFVSDSSCDVRDRITNDGPWYLVSTFPLGKVADSKDDLLDGDIDTNINVDQSGNDVSGGAATLAWTGSSSDGTSSGVDCSDWTSNSASADGTSGTVFKSDSGWAANAITDCNINALLYCFQIAF